MFFVNEVAKNGSNYLSPEDAAALNPKEAEMAIYGSKMALAMEMCALATIWLVKICLLILYHRLTLVTPSFAYELSADWCLGLRTNDSICWSNCCLPTVSLPMRWW
jgi:hypothetical protein